MQQTLEVSGAKGCVWTWGIPLKLAWAITIHKSQGATIPLMVADLSTAFEDGQAYVALSRVPNLDRLTLLGFSETSIKVDKRVG